MYEVYFGMLAVPFLRAEASSGVELRPGISFRHSFPRRERKSEPKLINGSLRSWVAYSIAIYRRK